MSKKSSNSYEKLYLEKLNFAKGEYSMNEFAKMAGISPGNFCKMLAGQVAQPATLEKVANARPDLEYLYEELMYAAGYSSNVPQTLKFQSYDSIGASEAFVSIPIVKNLELSKNKLLTNPDNDKILYPNKSLKSGKYFFYYINDQTMSPLVHEGDLVLFDMEKTPKDGDLVLFRVEKKYGIVRYYRKVKTKVVAYGGQNPAPDIFSKNEVEVIGIAIKAIVNF